MIKIASDADTKEAVAELEAIIDQQDGGKYRHYRTGAPLSLLMVIALLKMICATYCPPSSSW